MEGKRLLLSALDKCAGSEGNFEALEDLLALQASKSDSFNLKEIGDVMTDAEHECLWRELCAFSARVVEALQMDEDEDEEDEEEGAGMVEGAEELVHSLRRVAGTMTLYVVEMPQSRPASLFEALQLFHDLLMTLNDDIPGANALKSSVSRCCEAWWVKEEPGAENICNQLIPYLLLSALGPSTMDVDVKRCWAIRGALVLLDFDDPSIEHLRGLLLRCVIHPGFLKVAEGRRFLSFLFSINSNLPPLIVSVMKPQIAAGMKGVASAYGEVIYRAWKDSEAVPGLQAIIEESIQSLAHDTIHASDKKYFRGLRFVLGALHENKRIKGVDTMLLRVYGPILWRSLRCANALVRAQATMLFFDAFPLQDSDASTVESDSVLQKQFDLLSTLLKDADHRVRAAAVSGVFHILGEYWEALPLQTTRQILSYVVGTLGQDASCSEVRLVVVQGLCSLLDQPLAHGVLGGLLPLLSNAIHDNVEKVRVAFVEVLDKVKNIKNITFYDIVSEEKLFARLAEDAARPAVTTAMTKLLLNSFYPRDENGGGGVQMNAEQKNRCIKLIRINTGAAVAFYAKLHKFISIGSATKFCVMMFAVARVEGESEAGGNLPKSGADDVNANANVDADDDDDDDDDDTHKARSARSHPLAARAKRRRNQEVAKRARGAMVTKSASPASPALDMATRNGILRVVLSCFSSIVDELRLDIHEPSRELLGRHVTSEAVEEVFRIVAPGPETEGDIESLPILLKFIALVNHVMAVAVDAKDETKLTQQASMLSSENVIASYATAWASIDMDESLDAAARGCKHEQQAMACADVLCVLGATDDLLEAIRAPFQALEKSLQSTRPNKKAESKALTLGAAVHLLSAIVDSSEGSTSALKLRLLKEGDFFTFCFSVAQRAAVLPESTSTEISASLLLRCVHMNASIAVTRLTLDPADTADLEDFVVWMSSNIVASACDAGKSEQFHQAATVAVMALWCDCLVLKVATSTVETALDSWASSLLEFAKEGGNVSYLVPIIGRIVQVISHESCSRTLLEILFMQLGVDEEDLRPRRLVDGILRSSPGEAALSTSLRFVLSKIKSVKRKAKGVSKMKIEDANAHIVLELIKDSPHLAKACELTQKLMSDANDEAAVLLIKDLFNAASSKPSLKKQIYDGLVKHAQSSSDKENALCNSKLISALVPVSEEMDMEGEVV